VHGVRCAVTMVIGGCRRILFIFCVKVIVWKMKSTPSIAIAKSKINEIVLVRPSIRVYQVSKSYFDDHRPSIDHDGFAVG
jgi:hypothetical protein